MAIKFRIKAGANRPQTGAANVVLRAGVCSSGTNNARYEIDPGQDPTPDLGYGPLAAACAQGSRLGGAKQIALKVPATTAGTIGSVTETPSGTGPTITVAGSSFDSVTNSPYDAYKVRAKVLAGGAVGTARIGVNHDGGLSYPYTYDVPAEAPAILRGAVDLSGFTYPYAGLATKHLDFTAPAAAVLTFSGSFASAQAIADQFNTLAASSALTAGSETSDTGSFPVALAPGDTFVGKVDEQSVADTLTIVATAATKTGSGATYDPVTPGNTLTLTLSGTQYVVTFTGSESDQASFHATINSQISASGFASDATGETKLSTNHKGLSATGSIDAGDSDVLTSLGLSVAAFTAGTGNVANVAAVTAVEFADLLVLSFDGGTAGSTAIAIGTDRVKWSTNTLGASPNGVQFTSGTGVAKIAGFDTAEHNGTTAAPLDVAARVVQGKYLELYTTSAGAAETLTIDATASNAEDILGFTAADANLTATGSASLIVLPGTGLTLTFPATSDYVADTIYSFDTTAPRCSQAAVDTALAAANTDLSLAWGVTEIVQEPIDAPDLRSYANDLDSILTGWEAAEDKRFGVWVIGSPLDETDNNIKASMTGHRSDFGVVAVGDIYTTETTPMPKGEMRRSACRPLGIRLASQRLSEDPGVEPPLPFCSIIAPDGTTKSRNDSSASVKMGGSQGPGFTAIRSKAGLPYFKRGVTRAGANDVFVDLGVARMRAYAATIIFDRLRTYENRDFDLNSNGTIQEADASSLEEAFIDDLDRLLVRGKHASSVIVAIDREEKMSDTRNLTVEFAIQTRGQGEDITGVMNVTGDVAITGQAA